MSWKRQKSNHTLIEFDLGRLSASNIYVGASENWKLLPTGQVDFNFFFPTLRFYVAFYNSLDLLS